MKKVLIVLDDESAKVLEDSVNMSQTVREALKIYNGHISTDTIVGLRNSYKMLHSFMESKFEYYDLCFEKMDKLIQEIESMRNFG